MRILTRFTLMSLLMFPGLLEASTPALAGTWNSAPDETRLSTPFDESVWGKDAKAIRTVQMDIRSTGDAALTVTRKVVDPRGRTIAGSSTIEYADLVLGPPPADAKTVRVELPVTVKHAERRYPDDKAANWTLDGLRVTVTTFPDTPDVIEVRLDFAEGRGSFWETLRRGRK